MKTIIDAAKEYALTRNNANEIQFLHDFEAFKQGIEFAQKWISIEEELPDTNEFMESNIVLVKNEYRIATGRYYSNGNIWFPGDMKVTHWRPIERQ